MVGERVPRGTWRQGGGEVRPRYRRASSCLHWSRKSLWNWLTCRRPSSVVAGGHRKISASPPTLYVPAAPPGQRPLPPLFVRHMGWERHCFPDVLSVAHLAVKCSGCISTPWKAWSKHRQGHSHHYKLLDVSFARPVSLWQNIDVE